MKKSLLISAVVALSAPAASYADIIVADDFDGNTTGPARTVSFTDGGGSDSNYFRVTDGSDINAAYSNTSGSFFAAQDIDDIDGITDNGFGGQGASRQQLRYDGLDISGFSSLMLSLDAAASSTNQSAWDLADLVHATIVFDGVTPMDGDTGYSLWYDSIPDGDDMDHPVGLDPEYDGDGNAEFLVTDVFSLFTDEIPIPAGAGLTASLVITFDLNEDGEEFALDNIMLEGMTTDVPAPATFALFGLALAGLATRRRK